MNVCVLWAQMLYGIAQVLVSLRFKMQQNSSAISLSDKTSRIQGLLGRFLLKFATIQSPRHNMRSYQLQTFQKTQSTRNCRISLDRFHGSVVTQLNLNCYLSLRARERPLRDYDASRLLPFNSKLHKTVIPNSINKQFSATSTITNASPLKLQDG